MKADRQTDRQTRRQTYTLYTVAHQNEPDKTWNWQVSVESVFFHLGTVQAQRLAEYRVVSSLR